MIKVYNPSRVLTSILTVYSDLIIEEEVNQLNVLTLEIPEEFGKDIELEGYLELKGQGRYVVKEKNYTGDGYEIVALYDLEELSQFIGAKAYPSMTLVQMANDLLSGTGWVLQTSDTSVRTATGVNIDRLDLLYAIIRDTFGLEIDFDNQSKLIRADAELGEDRGVYFHDQVNLVDLTLESDTYSFATRLIPRGKDGLSIESINGGKPYLENHTYSEKVVTRYWQDDRYTIAENLMVAGQKILDDISKPLKSYSVKVIDLAKTAGINLLSYRKGDTITLVNKNTGTREKQRIIKRKQYLDNPEKDDLTVANRLRLIEDETKSEFDGVKQDFSVIRASLQLLGEEVTAKVSKNDYEADKEAMDGNYTVLSQKYDEIAATIQVGGGNNLIRNSVGYAEDLNFWALLSGSVNKGASTWILNGTSRMGWVLSDAVFYQDINLIPGKDYSLSGKLKKYTAAGLLKVELLNPETDAALYTVISKNAEVFEGEFSFEFNAGTLRKIRLRITAAGISVSSPAELTDLMLAQGSNLDVWSQANGEIYTLNVKIDSKGVTVYSSDAKGKTVMSPEEFAGYYNNSKIFTLNGDITEVMGISIGGKGLFIRPIKFVQTSNSVDVVWTGGA